jgi:hypothetical protein
MSLIVRTFLRYKKCACVGRPSSTSGFFFAEGDEVKAKKKRRRETSEEDEAAGEETPQLKVKKTPEPVKSKKGTHGSDKGESNRKGPSQGSR